MKRALIRIMLILILLAASVVVVIVWGTSTNKHRVSFYTDNGTPVPKTQYVNDHEYAVRPSVNPVKDGYVFLDWYLDGVVFNFESFPIIDDLVIFAYYEKDPADPIDYWVTFDADNNLSQVKVEEGKTVTKPADPVKEGYTFTGWYIGEDLYDFATKITDDIILIAKFEINKYVVTFDIDGTTSEESVRYGKTVKQPADPEKTGYTFIGWYLDDELYDFDTLVSKDMTLVARFEIMTFVVSFRSDGKTTEVVVEYGKTVAQPADPVKEGYLFIGWYLNGDEFDFNTPITSNITLIGELERITYVVTFVSDGTSSRVYVDYGNAVAKPADPVKEGHTFVGWYLDANLYDFSTILTGNITLTARFEINTYVVTFDNEGVTDSVEVEYGQTVTQPADPTKDHYTFVGWLLNGELYDFNTPVAENITLVAEFTIDTYTVSFDADGTITEVEVDYNQPVAKPADPVKEGHTFVGWLLNGIAYDFDTLVTDDITLVAEFTINTYVVTFDNEGVTDSVEVEYGQTVTQPADPTKDHYTFVGWLLNGELYDFNTPIAEDITLVAEFAIDTYIVSFDADGAITEVEVDYNQPVTQPADPVKEGHNFVGWLLNGIAYDFDTLVTDDITLVAEFEIMTFTITIDLLDGSTPLQVVVEYNEIYTPDEPQARTIFTFEYWEDINEVQIDFSVPVNQDITVYPFWSADVTTSEELYDAIAESRDGDYIFIQNDITLNDDIQIYNAIILDGNDFTIIVPVGYVFDIYNDDAEIVNLEVVKQ